ncbi:MAG: succinate--CoA ligase subunit alpha [candidate division Zixibacteria bacterium]|nr:succinate--CoA ligase subunit alpha [candidate division Zixibacteria bacterium]
MAILVTKDSKIMVQGITGGAGKFHTARMIEYGTNIVGGVTPGKGGQKVSNQPVFDTVEECVKQTDADVSAIFLPARFVKEAAVEAIRAGIKFLVIIPEHIPIHDMLHVRREAVMHGTTVIGGNTAGVISPGQANLGIMPDIAFKAGKVGTVSRSGSITYYIADTLTRSDYGESTCVGLGGDPVLGSTFDEILLKFEEDPETKAIVLTGEIGGVYEEKACKVIPDMKTPVLVMIGGIFAPPGKRMGHAGAIVEGRMGTAKEKLEMLADNGAYACKTFTDIPTTLKKLGV